MKTVLEILEDNVSDVSDWTSGFRNDIHSAMKEYAEEYHMERLRNPYIPFACKLCLYHTTIDALGGEYCKILKKCVASPNQNYKDAGCPLK